MFRIESYITSIILSYVDRYIKNFRQQDAQVMIENSLMKLRQLKCPIKFKKINV